MQYLFFDIEASEGRSMCSFGYVLTDSSFNVIAKEDILINPEARFCTQAWNKKKREEGKGITLAYPEKTFRKSPTFPQRYDKIKYLYAIEICCKALSKGLANCSKICKGESRI